MQQSIQDICTVADLQTFSALSLEIFKLFKVIHKIHANYREITF